MNLGIRRAAAAVLVALPALVIVPFAPPAYAAAGLTASKDAPASVLAGEPITYTLTASNPGDEASYNLSFRDVLPPGVTYAGPTTPAEAGEPQIVTNLVELPVGSGDVVPQQTLIWSNVADIQAGDDFSLSFAVATNGTTSADHPALPVYSVGSTVANVGEAYASTEARVLPRFDATGNPIPDPKVQTDTSPTRTTRLSAIQVDKEENSPEGELLRGVHDFTTTYTLRVRVSPQAGVDGVVLTDLLPAALEYLACGDVDNTPAPQEEYPGSGPLGTSPAIADCPTPVSVDTVQDPPADGSTTYPAGVYTAVRWDLGNLPAGTDLDVRYVAGVPLNENAPFPAPAPTPDSLQQGANLSNNTGPSTREGIPERSVTNIARVSGTYLGPLAPGATPAVSDDDQLTRTLEDVRIVKSVDPREFAAGGRATYTVQVDTSEYVSASGVVLTDQVPNGVCPLAPLQNFSDDQTLVCTGRAGDQSTVTVGGATTDVGFASVTENTTAGGYEVVFDPLPAIPASSSATVTYYGGMRQTYELGPNDGAATVAGDSFVNRVAATATTTPIPPSPETGDVQVADSSRAEQVTGGLSIDKQLLPRGRLAPGAPCPETGYAEPTTPGDPRFLYRLGDRVCFRLRVNFPALTYTRDATIGDFLPVGVEYEAGSMFATSAHSNAPFVFDEAAAVSGLLPPVWLAGRLQGLSRYTEPGAVFDVVLAGRVVDVPDKDTPLITGNLMKMRTRSTDGRAQSYRDQVPFSIAPAPEVGIAKGVASVDAPPFSTTSPDVDGVTVQEGSVATFHVDVTNNGSVASGNDYSVRGLDVWDVLPPGITCAAISDITDFADDKGGGPSLGTCTDPNDPGHPDFQGSDSRSAIRWILATDPADPNGGVDRWRILPGETRTLTYRMTIPTPTAAGTRLVNTSAVRSFEAFTNEQDVSATYYPADNIDQAVPPADWNAPAASDPSDVVTPGPVVEKAAVTSVDEPNNNLTRQAVPGETITYTYSVTVPANTSVLEGVLRDGITANANRVTLLSADWSFVPDATTGTAGSKPGGFSLSPTGVLTFPLVWTNATATPQRFAVTLTFRVLNNFSQNNVGVSNTAAFESVDELGEPIDTPDATWQVTLLQPSPSVTKTASPTTVTAGDRVLYTVRSSNSAGRPPLHDAWLEDCIPDGLSFDGFAAVYANTIGPEPGSATNGCDPTQTYVAFGLGTINGGTSVSRGYYVTVDPPAVGGTSYRNAAALTGSSLDDGKGSPDDPDNPVERTYRAQTGATVQVPGAGVTKTVTPTSATIGETVAYTSRAVIPANTNFYEAALRDQLPPGLDPASLVVTGIECLLLTTPALPCGLSATTLPTVADPAVPGGHLVAFLVGDIAASPAQRAVTISYTMRMADVPSSVAGSNVTNRVQTVWNDTAGKPEPTLPTYAWTNAGSSGTASVTVLEPDLSITKAVSNTTPEPDDLFTYTLDVRNGTTNAGSAYGLVITDVVPAGVIVVDGSISNGGEYDPDTRTITWDAADLPGPVTPGEVLQLTYVAQLAPSSQLTTGVTLTNTATIQTYLSYPTDGRPYGPEAPATATVTPDFPKLQTVKTAVGGEPTYLDTPYPWRVVVTNVGTGTGYATAVRDVLPVGWLYDAGSAVITLPGGTTVQRDPVQTLIAGGGQDLRWSDVADLLPGQSVTVAFTARATASTVSDPGIGSAIRQTNTASSATFDATGASGNASGPYGNSDVTASTRIDKVDLRVQKLPAASAPVAGTSYSWRVRVTNLSTTDTAAGPFTVVDTFPTTAGVTFVSAAGTGWRCNPATATSVTCTRTSATATLAPGASFPDLTVTFALSPTVPASTQITNGASVAGKTYETDPTNNSTTSTVTVATQADLKVLKAHAGTPVAGRPLSYTIAVSNLGPSVSRAAITVTDTLPTGVAFVGVTAGSPWSCIKAGPTPGGTVTCILPTDLAVGPAPVLSIDVAILPGTTGQLVNTATVAAGPTTDPNPSNNTSTDTVTPGTSADLFVEKVSTTPLLAGTTGTYRLRVGNNGPSDAAAVQVSDALPPGLTFVGATSVNGSWTCSPTDASAVAFGCSLAGTLAAGGEATVDVEVAIASDVTGVIVNEAVVSSTTPDPIPGNNRDSDRTDAQAEADLTIVKRGPRQVVAGEGLSWTLTVENLGPSDSTGPIVVEDALPPDVAFASADGTGWTCSHDGSTTGGLVTCSRPGPLPAAPSADRFAPDITVAATVLPSAGPGRIVNAAVVEGPIDPNPDNDDASHAVTVVDEVDLVLAKSVEPTATAAGREVTYTITVTNDGPSDADTSVVTDVLPAGMTAVSATSDTWTCPSATGTQVVCGRDVIPAGDVSTITVVALVDSSVPDGTILTNDAVVRSITAERNPENNTASVDLPVFAEADLYLLKTHPAGPVVAGTNVVFTLTAGNRGPSDAVAPVVITDQLPVGLTFVSSSGPWTCDAGPVDPSGQEVLCTLDATALAAGATSGLQMTVATDPSADPGTYVNVATVTSPTGDAGGTGDNTATDEVELVTSADLSITKVHDADAVRVGDDLDFTLTVSNAGPSEARDVVVSESLPAGLSLVGAAGDGWSCKVAAPTLVCSLDAPLAPGATAEPITVTATVLASAYPSVVNEANVSASTPDPNQEDNAASDTVTVPPLVDLTITKRHAGTPQVGGTITYTLVVTNLGPTADPGPVTVTDPLPASLTPVSASGTGATCSTAGQVVTCTLGNGLAVNQSATLTVVATVLPSAYPSVVNTVTVSTPSEQTDTTNDSATDTATVTPDVRLQVVKTRSSLTGSLATWSIEVSNVGRSATVDPVVMTDDLPAGLGFVSVQGQGWSCTGTQQVVCTYGSPLAAGAIAPVITLVTEVTAPAGTVITNVAVVTGGSPSTPSVQDDAQVVVSLLPPTGGSLDGVPLALALLAIGAVLVLVSRRRRA